MTTLPLNVHLPKSAFSTADSEVPITVSSINIPFQTGNTSFHSIDSAITFNVVQPKDVFDEQISTKNTRLTKISTLAVI